ncbi:MAG: transcription antitermination factor NusB [Acidobacteriota bacterium]|nr:transcription antitermination factor NusB [Acidobacteriota bacterium]
MGQRRRGREYALQMMFQIDVTDVTPEQVFPTFWEAQNAADEVVHFAETLVSGVTQELGDLDRQLGELAKNWRLERMAVVDRNVLRIALWELIHSPETPPAVVIDEAIEVAKKYGSHESGSFINGVLDAARRATPGRDSRDGAS